MKFEFIKMVNAWTYTGVADEYAAIDHDWNAVIVSIKIAVNKLK